MATSNGRKTASSNKRTTQSKKRTPAGKRKTKAQAAQDSALFHEIGLIVLFAAMVFLFCCNFGIIGPIGDKISGVLFGLFGLTAYAVPVLLFLAVAFYFANEGNANAARKLIAGLVLFVMLGIVCDLFAKQAGGMEKYDIKLLYEGCRDGKSGGGVLAGSLSFLHTPWSLCTATNAQPFFQMKTLTLLLPFIIFLEICPVNIPTWLPVKHENSAVPALFPWLILNSIFTRMSPFPPQISCAREELMTEKQAKNSVSCKKTGLFMLLNL